MSSLGKNDATSPEDLLYYAPRRMRERSQEAARSSWVSDTAVEDLQTERDADNLDRIFERAVFKSLLPSLEPEIMPEPPDDLPDTELRSSVFKIVGCAIGVAATIAFLFVALSPTTKILG